MAPYKGYIPIAAGINRLTWKATKNYTGLREDIVLIDNIKFEPFENLAVE